MNTMHPPQQKKKTPNQELPCWWWGWHVTHYLNMPLFSAHVATATVTFGWILGNARSLPRYFVRPNLKLISRVINNCNKPMKKKQHKMQTCQNTTAFWYFTFSTYYNIFLNYLIPDVRSEKSVCFMTSDPKQRTKPQGLIQYIISKDVADGATSSLIDVFICRLHNSSLPRDSLPSLHVFSELCIHPTNVPPKPSRTL